MKPPALRGRDRPWTMLANIKNHRSLQLQHHLGVPKLAAA